MSEKGKLSTLQLVALAMLAISAVVSSSSSGILSDRQVIKREIFIQKLAARMDGQTR